MTSTLHRQDTAAPVGQAGVGMVATSAMATATVAGRAFAFAPMYRDGNESPVAVTATVCLPLSFDDLVAAVWVMAEGDDPDNLPVDPADPTGVPALAMEALVSLATQVTDAAAEIASIAPGTADHARLRQVRALVTAAFGLTGPEVTR